MESEAKKASAARVLKIFALLLLIILSITAFLLLFALVPMPLFGGNVQLDSGGFLDLLLRRTQHASGIIPATLVFLGALPLVISVLLLLADSVVLFLFLRRAEKCGAWFFSAGKRYWVTAAVFSALNAAVPSIVSAAVTAPVATSGTFAVRPWNPLGGILLFAVVLALTVLYFVKTNRLAKTTPPEESEAS